MALFSEPIRWKYVEKNADLLLTRQLWKADITQSLLSLCQMREGGGGGGSERKRFTDSRLLKWNIGKGKKDIESGKCLRRKRNESVLNDISPSF